MSSACSTKYDPDLLKADVALARTRVARLKREMEQIRIEMKYQEQGVKTLAESVWFFSYNTLYLPDIDFLNKTMKFTHEMVGKKAVPNVA